MKNVFNSEIETNEKMKQLLILLLALILIAGCQTEIKQLKPTVKVYVIDEKPFKTDLWVSIFFMANNTRDIYNTSIYINETSRFTTVHPNQQNSFKKDTQNFRSDAELYHALLISYSNGVVLRRKNK